MIKSMTGYGRGQAQVDGLSFSVEIKAVNHRYGDINIKAPRVLMPLESQIKKQVSAVLKRGKVRRARLYYLRDLVGKKARIKERTYIKK